MSIEKSQEKNREPSSRSLRLGFFVKLCTGDVMSCEEHNCSPSLCHFLHCLGEQSFNQEGQYHNMVTEGYVAAQSSSSRGGIGKK